MRIERGQLICGYPAITVRGLIRKWPSDKHVEGIKEVMGLSSKKAHALLGALISEAFIEINPDRPWAEEDDTIYKFVPTVKGAALAQASAGKPIRRELARQRLHELIERMRIVNEDPQFIVGVEEAFVFGSYLSTAERLGDLDVTCTLYQKIQDMRTFTDMGRASARESGRHFRTIVDHVGWPWTQVMMFLKNRSPVYSLSQNEGLLADPSIPRIAIFSGRKPVPNWREL